MAENLKQIIEFQAKGINRLKGQYKDLERRTKGLEGSTGRASGAMGGMIAKLGLTTVALYGTMRAISAVVRVGKEFEKNMSNVAAISGATGAELTALEKNAQKLGETTVFTASNVASLQVEFAKLGFSAKEITGVTKDTLALASATGSDLATSAAVAGQTLRAFGLDVGQTSRITDTMAASFSSSALDMDKFTNSMQYVAPIAKQVGIDVEGTTAILGTLANAGISGSMAGTSLRKILLELGNESSALTKKIGFSVKNSDDLTKAFEKLNTMGLGTGEMKKLVGQRAISAFNILLEGTKTTNKLAEELRNSAGAAQDMADIQLDNLEGKMTLLSSATEGLGIALFDLADDSITSVVTALTSLTSGMTTLIKYGLDGFREATEDTSDALSQMMIKTNDQASQFKQLTNSLLYLARQTDLSNTQIERRNDLQDQLKKQFPNYLKNLDVEKQGYTDIAREISSANKQLKAYHEQQLKEATAQKFRDDIASQTAELSKLQVQLERMKDPTDLYYVKANKDQWKTIEGTEERISLIVNTLDNLMKAYEKAQESATSFGLVVTPTTEGEDAPDDPSTTGKIKNDKLRELTKTELAIYQNHLTEKRTLLGEDHQYQLDSLEWEHSELVAIYQAQGEDINNLQVFFDKKKAQIQLNDETRTRAHYSAMASNFASFVGQFAGGQKAAARLQQVAALIDAYSAANQLMADPKLIALYPANKIAAASALATGLANAMAISKSIGEFTSAETGFDGIVNKPTMFMTGENNKAERVSVTPLESPNINGAQGGGNININISAMTADEAVIDTIIPALERAKALNLA